MKLGIFMAVLSLIITFYGMMTGTFIIPYGMGCLSIGAISVGISVLRM